MGLETVPFHLHKYWKTFLFVKRILLALFSWDCYPYRNHRYQDYRRPSSKKLAEKYYPTVEEVEKEMNGSARSRVQLFAIRIEHMTGKLVNEK